MGKYTDNSIKNIDYIKMGKEIITVPSGYSHMREAGNVVEHEGQFIWTSTVVRTVNGKKEFTSHYWISNGNPEVWIYKGKLNLPFQSEDGYLVYDNHPLGNWHFLYENKDAEFPTDPTHSRRYIISHAVSDSLGGKWKHVGGSSGLTAFGDGYAKSAVYSPTLPFGLYKMYFGGRKITVKPHTEEEGFAGWKASDKKYIPSSTSILKAEANGYQSLDFANNVFEVDGQYVAELGGLRNWSVEHPEKGFWCRGIALSDDKVTGWKVINYALKDQYDRHVFTNFFHTDQWYSITNFGSNSTSFYLATIVEKGTQPPVEPPIEPPSDCDYIAEGHPITRHINNDHKLPLHSGSISDNVILMREARPLINGLTIPSDQEPDRERIIDLIDEIG